MPGGIEIPILCPSWRTFPAKVLVMDGKRYTHRFQKFLVRRYSLQHLVLCDGKGIGGIVQRIDSILLGFKLGGHLRMEVTDNDLWQQVLFFGIARWWTGYYLDTTPT